MGNRADGGGEMRRARVLRQIKSPLLLRKDSGFRTCSRRPRGATHATHRNARGREATTITITLLRGTSAETPESYATVKDDIDVVEGGPFPAALHFRLSEISKENSRINNVSHFSYSFVVSPSFFSYGLF